MNQQQKRVLNNTRKQILLILKRELPYLKEKYGIERIFLYGSFAKGNPKRTSDIDILVDIRKPIGLEFVELADLLEKKLGRRVDLATLSHYQRSFGNPRYRHIAENIRKSIIYV